MTKREKFEQVIALAKGEPVTLTPEEFEEFAKHEIEVLSRKSSASSGKLTKTQKENEEYKAAILATLAETGRPLTISELMVECEALADLKNQRVSAIVTLLKKAGLVVRTEDKKKAYFSLPTATEEGEGE